MRWKLGAKFSIFLVLIFLIGSSIKILTLSQHFNHQAEEAVAERAEILLNTMQAVRNYTQMNIQPQLESSSEESDPFILESVPNFAARTVFADFRQRAPDFKDFSYKEAAPNPTNLEDRTDEFEARIVQKLRALPPDQPKLLSGYRTLEGKKLFYLAQPLIMKDTKCLKCHGNPRNAPQSLINIYGDQNGFGWKLDEVIAAQMLYVPADQILARGRQNLQAVTTILLSLFGALFLVINLLLWHTVIQPLKILTKVARQISSCSIHQDEKTSDPPQSLDILTNRKDEPGQLAQAFQFMVAVLSQREQDLQLAVQERTLWLEQEMQERQTAQESLQTYSHAINHDLRNLVMGISSLVQGILFQTFGADQTPGVSNIPRKSSNINVEPEALAMIQKSCDRQLNLMNSLMSVESSEIWRAVLKLKTIDLFQLTQDLQIAYEPKLVATASTLENQILGDVPKIQADSNQLKRVFENLMDNALKYNPEGVDIRLTAIVCDDNQSMLRFTVADNGVGIDPAKQHDLFGLYTRGHSDHVFGHGLGLYICRKIVEAHGGTIGINTPHSGAEFWFTLPL